MFHWADQDFFLVSCQAAGWQAVITAGPPENRGRTYMDAHLFNLPVLATICRALHPNVEEQAVSGCPCLMAGVLVHFLIHRDIWPLSGAKGHPSPHKKDIKSQDGAVRLLEFDFQNFFVFLVFHSTICTRCCGPLSRLLHQCQKWRLCSGQGKE